MPHAKNLILLHKGTRRQNGFPCLLKIFLIWSEIFLIWKMDFFQTLPKNLDNSRFFKIKSFPNLIASYYWYLFLLKGAFYIYFNHSLNTNFLYNTMCKKNSFCCSEPTFLSSYPCSIILVYYYVKCISGIHDLHDSLRKQACFNANLL